MRERDREVLCVCVCVCARVCELHMKKKISSKFSHGIRARVELLSEKKGCSCVAGE